MTLADEDRALNALVNADLADALPVFGASYYASLFPGRSNVAVFIRDYAIKYGRIPEGKVLRRKFPSEWPSRPEAPEPLDACLEELRRDLLEEIQVDYSNRAADANTSGDVKKFCSIVEEMQAKIAEVLRPLVEGGKLVSDLTTLQLARLDKDAQLALKAIPTGLPPMDRELSGGATPGMLIVFAALVNLGKTYVFCQIAENMRAAGYRALLVPLEMSADVILERCACIRYGLNVNEYIKKQQPEESVKKGESKEDWYRGILQSRLALEKADTCKGETIVETSASATTTADIKRWIMHHKADAVLIDAAQDIQPSTKASSRTEGLYAALAELNNIARELSVPIFMSVQLGSEVEKKNMKTNTLVQIQWSQAFAQKAQCVFTMLGDRTTSDREVRTDKNRDGDVGSKWEIKMHFPNVKIVGQGLQARGFVTEEDLYESPEAFIDTILNESEDDEDEEDDEAVTPPPAADEPDPEPEDAGAENPYQKAREDNRAKRLRAAAFRKLRR